MSASICCSGLPASSSSGIMAQEAATGEEGSSPACSSSKNRTAEIKDTSRAAVLLRCSGTTIAGSGCLHIAGGSQYAAHTGENCMLQLHTSPTHQLILTCKTCYMLETRSHAAAMCMRGQQAMHTSCAGICFTSASVTVQHIQQLPYLQLFLFLSSSVTGPQLYPSPVCGARRRPWPAAACLA
jgi:hypothetical protein